MTASTQRPEILDFNFEVLQLSTNGHQLSLGVARPPGGPAVPAAFNQRIIHLLLAAPEESTAGIYSWRR
jgi:hypothetical protein